VTEDDLQGIGMTRIEARRFMRWQSQHFGVPLPATWQPYSGSFSSSAVGSPLSSAGRQQQQPSQSFTIKHYPAPVVMNRDARDGEAPTIDDEEDVAGAASHMSITNEGAGVVKLEARIKAGDPASAGKRLQLTLFRESSDGLTSTSSTVLRQSGGRVTGNERPPTSPSSARPRSVRSSRTDEPAAPGTPTGSARAAAAAAVYERDDRSSPGSPGTPGGSRGLHPSRSKRSSHASRGQHEVDAGARMSGDHVAEGSRPGTPSSLPLYPLSADAPPNGAIVVPVPAEQGGPGGTLSITQTAIPYTIIVPAPKGGKVGRPVSAKSPGSGVKANMLNQLGDIMVDSEHKLVAAARSQALTSTSKLSGAGHQRKGHTGAAAKSSTAKVVPPAGGSPMYFVLPRDGIMQQQQHQEHQQHGHHHRHSSSSPAGPSSRRESDAAGLHSSAGPRLSHSSSRGQGQGSLRGRARRRSSSSGSDSEHERRRYEGGSGSDSDRGPSRASGLNRTPSAVSSTGNRVERKESTGSFHEGGVSRRSSASSLSLTDLSPDVRQGCRSSTQLADLEGPDVDDGAVPVLSLDDPAAWAVAVQEVQPLHDEAGGRHRVMRVQGDVGERLSTLAAGESSSLDLSGRNLDGAGLELVAALVGSQPGTAKVRLDSCNISASGMPALSKAVRGNQDLSMLSLGANRIEDKAAAHLASALNGNTSLSHLHLWSNGIGAKGAEAIGKVLQAGSCLSVLNLRANRLGDSGCMALFQAIVEGGSNKTLSWLSLSSNDIGPTGIASLAAWLTQQDCPLRSLYIATNKMHDGGAYTLSEALKQNSSLTVLDVHDNNIGPQGTRWLSSAVLKNTSITSLDISHNPIGWQGATALAHALQGNASITNLNAWNCSIQDEGRRALTAALKAKTKHTEVLAPDEPEQYQFHFLY